MFPSKYLEGHSFKYEDIMQCRDLDEIKAKIADHETEKTMHESHKEWIKIFQSHKLDYARIADITKELDEIYARRNIIVHNSGIVNEAYRNVVRNTDVAIGQS